MLGAAIGQIVAIDRSDHHMVEAELGDGVGDVLRLVRIERRGNAGGHVAEGAGAGADLAHDHHGRVLLAPALADVRAARFLADRHEIVLAHDLLGFLVDGRTGRPHPDPVRLAQHFRIGPVGLFGMPNAAFEQRNQRNWPFFLRVADPKTGDHFFRRDALTGNQPGNDHDDDRTHRRGDDLAEPDIADRQLYLQHREQIAADKGAEHAADQISQQPAATDPPSWRASRRPRR